MKKLVPLQTLVLCLFVCTVSCTNEIVELENDMNDVTDIRFNVYGFQMEQEMTRASLNESFNMLEVAIYKKEADNSYTLYREIDQSSTNTGFGVVTMENVKCGDYKLVALGHNDKQHPDMEDPSDISFSNYPDAYLYTKDITVTKSTSAVDMPLVHASARVRFEIEGYIPNEAKKLHIRLEGASNNLNAITGFAKTTCTREVDLEITDAQRSSNSITGSMYIFLTKDELTSSDSYVNFTLSGLDASNGIIDTQSFNGIPLKKGFTTKFSGVFFNYGSVGVNVTADNTWGALSSISF